MAAISQVHRDPVTDLITQIDTPKQNLAEENLDVLLFTLNYGWSMGTYGSMVFESSYTHVLKHNFVRFPGDPQIDYLTSPFYSTEFQDKANARIDLELPEVQHHGVRGVLRQYAEQPGHAGCEWLCAAERRQARLLGG